ncbi:GTP-binding protein [Marinomonas sp. THO17]|uniref:CobW family GTP-binding protein n=1 Tax=Marinomonas sp. THO17 TaxID=3149048 RepID=UPI00336BE71F
MNDITPSNGFPVTLLTGFLGSGKTTILNKLLNQEDMANTLVIINEFGEVGLDHLLVEESQENLRLLQSGCICCTVRGDLVDTLMELYEKQEKGDIAPFSRVMIETTGLADPMPIVQTFQIDSGVTGHFHLQQVITLVDAVNGLTTLKKHTEAVKQISIAQKLFITKSDLVEESITQKLEKELKLVNPAASCELIFNGEIAAQRILEIPEKGPNQWQVEAASIDAYIPLAKQTFSLSNAVMHPLSHHAGKIRSYCLIFDHPLPEAELVYWLELMSTMRAENILRIKGIIEFQEKPGQPVIIHGVQQVTHPFVIMPEWPSDDHRSRIVIIAENLSEAEIVRTFEHYVGVSVPKLAS